MSIFINIIRKIFEKNPVLLKSIHQSIIETTSIEAFKNEQIYYFEQINKYIPVESYIDNAEIEIFMYNALAESRIDDFCFLFKLLRKKGIEVIFDRSKVQNSYNTLAKRGNIAGLETVINKTGIVPKLKKENILKSYNSLIANGRIEAVDYIRQLSNIPVQFSENAINLGFQYLFLSNKYEMIEKMIQITGMKPNFNYSLLMKSINCEIDDLNFKAVYTISKYLGTQYSLNVNDFNIGLNKLLRNSFYEQIPYLFSVYSQESISILDDEILDKILYACDSWSVDFIYSQPNLMEFKLRNVDFAFKIALKKNDLNLIINICKITKKRMLPLQCAPFFEKALLETDIEKVRALVKYTDGLPEFQNEILQLFLQKLMIFNEIENYKRFTEIFGCANHDIGSFVYAVETANLRSVCELYERSTIIQDQLSWANNIYQIAKELKIHYE